MFLHLYCTHLINYTHYWMCIKIEAVEVKECFLTNVLTQTSVVKLPLCSTTTTTTTCVEVYRLQVATDQGLRVVNCPLQGRRTWKRKSSVLVFLLVDPSLSSCPGWGWRRPPVESLAAVYVSVNVVFIGSHLQNIFVGGGCPFVDSGEGGVTALVLLCNITS